MRLFCGLLEGDKGRLGSLAGETGVDDGVTTVTGNTGEIKGWRLNGGNSNGFNGVVAATLGNEFLWCGHK